MALEGTIRQRSCSRCQNSTALLVTRVRIEDASYLAHASRFSNTKHIDCVADRASVSSAPRPGL